MSTHVCGHRYKPISATGQCPEDIYCNRAPREESFHRRAHRPKPHACSIFTSDELETN